MKRYIRSSTYDKHQGPRGYVYQLCDMMGWRYPMFIDTAAGGYTIKFDSSIRDRAIDNFAGTTEGTDYQEKLRQRHQAWDSFYALPEEEQRRLLDEAETQLIDEGNQDLAALKDAASQLGIKLVRAFVKPKWGNIRFYAVVPRKESQVIPEVTR